MAVSRPDLDRSPYELRILVRYSLALLVPVLIFSGSDVSVHAATDFESQVKPILEERCFKCHSHTAEKLKGGLFLDSRSGMLLGGDSGPALVPGDVAATRIVEAIHYDNPDLQMPPKTKLSDEEIAVLEKWVMEGANWPGGETLASGPVKKGFDLKQRRAEHWAWQPVAKVTPPVVNDSKWASTPVDAFVLSKLESAEIQPAPEADRRTLVRRLYLTLTGLPPTPEEVAAFEKDSSENAFGQLVDRLLASPKFGERWGRHWMDVVRYSETLGHEFDYDLPNAWRYRDYLIRAINEDIPYDQFVREHLAGDLLENPRINPETGLNESAMATAFFWFGQQVHSPVDIKAYQLEVIDNQIDTLSRGFQGLTVSCARCHDHKFDAISTKDYYALYGVLESSRYAQIDIQNPAAERAQLEDLARLRSEFAAEVDSNGVITPASATNGVPSPWAGEWSLSGPTSEYARVAPGELLFLRLDDPVVRATVLLISSRRLSRFVELGVHSPNFSLTNRYLHVRAAGQGSRVKLILENFQMIQNPIYGELKKVINDASLHWITFDLNMWQGRRAYLELLDSATADLAGTAGSGVSGDGWFDLAEVVASDNPKPPDRADAFTNVEISASAKKLLALLANTHLGLERAVRIPGMTDSQGVDEHVFIRGGPNNPGDLVQRRFLEGLGGLDQPIKSGSGRLQIANLIACADNPLTARVWVNRIWHQLFGRGIVPTVDDFGVLGERPSNPELLDWLANWFVTEGEWSTKKLIKMLVRTSTWKQSAIAADDRSADHPTGTDGISKVDQLDPQNVLLHKWTVRRLEGEAIRDSILAVSGRLDLNPPGESIKVHLTDFMSGRGRPGTSGPLDGDGKRSVYLEVRRNFMSPMMLAFDTPQTSQTFGRRSRSNVPAQALILLNDPFVQQQAGLLADRMLKETKSESTAERVGWLYEQALQREPTEKESVAAAEFLGDVPAKQAWADLCHVLFNTKEFVFVN